MRNPGESFDTDVSLVVKTPNFQLLTIYYSKYSSAGLNPKCSLGTQDCHCYRKSWKCFF